MEITHTSPIAQYPCPPSGRRHSAPPARPRAARQAQGFTLIELLTVMAIIALILGISVAAFKDLGRGPSLRSSVLRFRSALSQARQNAITSRKRTSLLFGTDSNSVSYFYVSTTLDDMGLIGSSNFLAEGVIFSNLTDPSTLEFSDSVTFKIDGSADMGSGYSKQIVLAEDRPDGMVITGEVWALTGRVRFTKPRF